MFMVRRAKVEDADTLLKLAKMVHFINLPPDREIIQAKITQSRRSFMRAAAGEPPIGPPKKTKPGQGLAESLRASDLFMFTLEDIEHRTCIGSSQLVAHMGGPDRPNVSLKLEKREYFSESLQTGTTHTVAQVYLDESSPTEIGGLILQPSFRGHKLRLGRFLGLVRFHFIGLHRQLFADRVLAEMMAPISPEGDNLLWDYLGRRFIPLSYDEADRFCQRSHEFILSLLPREPIFLALLPPAARAIVGQVGPDTVPARRMLEKLGFEYRDFVDPFDGGPHLDCPTDDITIVRETYSAPLGKPIAESKLTHRGIVSTLDTDGEFRAIEQPFALVNGEVRLVQAAHEALQAREGTTLGVTILEGPSIAGRSRSKTSSSKTAKKPAKKTAKKQAKKSAKKTKKKAAKKARA